jgi:hypothetical protein
MVRVTNDDEPAGQDLDDADGGDDASQSWRNLAPQLEEFPVR